MSYRRLLQAGKALIQNQAVKLVWLVLGEGDSQQLLVLLCLLHPRQWVIQRIRLQAERIPRVSSNLIQPPVVRFQFNQNVR